MLAIKTRPSNNYQISNYEMVLFGGHFTALHCNRSSVTEHFGEGTVYRLTGGRWVRL